MRVAELKSRRRLAPNRYWCLEWHSELGSTMERAAELALEGAPAGMVVVADFQSQGRGTHGRVWHAPHGTCLMFTILVRPAVQPDHLSELPGRVAASLSALLRTEFGVSLEVKPPNDVLVSGRKICGVLCSSRVTGPSVDWVLCGIGLNTWMRDDQLPVDTATSLLVEVGDGIMPHPQLLELILSRLVWLRDL